MIADRHVSGDGVDRLYREVARTPEQLAAVTELLGWEDQARRRLRQLTFPDDFTQRAGVSLILATFCHTNPSGGRFTTGDLGAWYAGFSLDTAIAETVHAHDRRLRASGMLSVTLRMRALEATVQGEFDDLRGLQASVPEIYDPNSYARSQIYGSEVRRSGRDGIVYDSVRRVGGTCIAVFQPAAVLGVRRTKAYEYRWAGSSDPIVERLEIQ
jgi:RES domain